ncbi:MAG: peptide-methionine (S)-S-oxide reductase MsrA, partial [Saprospiraceae bacterium]|nr:peptide-methionine (S)-S-oxide reductase MsrA [Saprospiraceae bacterium]
MQSLLYVLISLFMLNTGSCTGKGVQLNDSKEQKKGTFPVDEYTKANNLESYSTAVFAGGCFWCTEAAYQRIVGVVDVISGYSGGDEEYPSYEAVGTGRTSHAEAIYIYYDDTKTDYQTLLEVFFIAHDPTTLNYQGPDFGEEYRSAIFYKTDEEKSVIDQVIKETNE